MGERALGPNIRPWPFLVAVGLGLLLPWAFIFQLIFGHSLMAIISLTLAFNLLLLGGVGWACQRYGYIDVRRGLWSSRATWIFLGVQLLLSALVFISFWFMRSEFGVWPPQGSPEVLSPSMAMLVLLASSVTATFAKKERLKNCVSGYINFTLVTVLFWIVYSLILMISWVELSGAGYSIGTNVFTMSFYCITGAHFAYVLFGTCLLCLSIPLAFKGRLNTHYVSFILFCVHFINAFGIWGLPQLFM